MLRPRQNLSPNRRRPNCPCWRCECGGLKNHLAVLVGVSRITGTAMIVCAWGLLHLLKSVWQTRPGPASRLAEGVTRQATTLWYLLDVVVRERRHLEEGALPHLGERIRLFALNLPFKFTATRKCFMVRLRFGYTSQTLGVLVRFLSDEKERKLIIRPCSSVHKHWRQCK